MSSVVLMLALSGAPATPAWQDGMQPIAAKSYANHGHQQFRGRCGCHCGCGCWGCHGCWGGCWGGWGGYGCYGCCGCWGYGYGYSARHAYYYAPGDVQYA